MEQYQVIHRKASRHKDSFKTQKLVDALETLVKEVNITDNTPVVEGFVASVDLSREDDFATIGVSKSKNRKRDKLNRPTGSSKDV